MQTLFHENVVIVFFYATQHECILSSFEYNMIYFKNVGRLFQTVADNHSNTSMVLLFFHKMEVNGY